MTPTYAWRLAKVSVKENIQNFFTSLFSKSMASVGKGLSHNGAGAIGDKQTFNQFEDEDI